MSSIPNEPYGNQLKKQAKKYVWIIYINIEETIKYQGVLDYPQSHQTQRGKSKFKISI